VGWDPINQFNPNTFYACPKSGPELVQLRLEVVVCFIDIGESDDQCYFMLAGN
jgi:hypothetical protein